MVDGFWNHVEKTNYDFQCKFCGFKFAKSTSISRIKTHFSGFKGLGISICKRVPDDVKEAACQAIQDAQKRRKTVPGSSNDMVQNPVRDVEMTPLEAQRPEQAGECIILSDIELQDWMKSMSRGEIVFVDQGRAAAGIETHSAKGEVLPTVNLIGCAFERTVDGVWSLLMKEEVSSIGIYGIGGVGKTALATHINNRLLERPSSFQHVFWITVSQDFSIYKLQNLVAKAVDLDLSDEEDEKKRAVELSKRLIAKQKYVLILDDLWNHFSLEKVGITFGVTRSKLILTSRSLEVCQRMGCQEKLKVEQLTEDEAWTLFSEKLGISVELPEEVRDLAKSVVSECAGLPLGIIAMAGSMCQVNDIGRWRDALEKLKGSNIREGDAEADIFKILEFSYMNLNDSALQRAFLYCALFPVDSKINRADVIEYMIVEGIIGKRKSRQAEVDKGHTMLNKLENSCLIESCMQEGYRCIQMNGLLRDMAIKIQRMNSQIMVEAGALLEKLPDLEKWTEDLVRVSLVKNYIKEIPSNHSPRCSKLSTLLLSQNYMLHSIADSFFMHLNGLTLLDLSNTGIERLPGSISDLVCLTTLLLGKCTRLRHVPTLAKLGALKKLDLSYTELVELPEGMELLSNLRYLNLSHTRLKELSAGILANLFRLQVLRIIMSSETPVTIKGEEVACLKKLETLECSFCDLIDFNKYIKSWEEIQPLTAYNFTIGPVVPLLSTTHKSALNKVVRFCNCHFSRQADFVVLLETIQALEIVQCHELMSLCDVPSIKYANKMKSLVIWDCNGMECLLPVSMISPDILRSLETLHLRSLKNFCAFFSIEGAPPLPVSSNHVFPSLKTCKIFRCPNMRRLFPPVLLSNLQNLEVVEVVYCDNMEVIIETDGGGIIGEESNPSSITHSFVSCTAISLPKLRILTLIGLPELKSIYNEVMICSSFEEINVVDCPKLKRIPISLPVPCLQKIKIKAYPKGWWESVVWQY